MADDQTNKDIVDILNLLLENQNDKAEEQSLLLQAIAQKLEGNDTSPALNAILTRIDESDSRPLLEKIAEKFDATDSRPLLQTLIKKIEENDTRSLLQKLLDRMDKIGIERASKPAPAQEIKIIYPDSLTRGEPGKDGKSPTKDELLALIEPLIPEAVPGAPGKDGSPDTAEQIIEKIKGKFSYNDLANKPDFAKNFGKHVGAGYLRELSDVNIGKTDPPNGYVLGWSAAQKAWIPMVGGGGGAGNPALPAWGLQYYDGNTNLFGADADATRVPDNVNGGFDTNILKPLNLPTRNSISAITPNMQYPPFVYGNFTGSLPTTYTVTITNLDTQTFDYVGLIGVVSVGDTIVGDNTLATGTVIYIDATTIIIENSVGNLTGEASFTDTTSGATGTFNTFGNIFIVDMFTWTDGTTTVNFVAIDRQNIQPLNNGVSVYFYNATGNTIGDSANWTYASTPTTGYEGLTSGVSPIAFSPDGGFGFMQATGSVVDYQPADDSGVSGLLDMTYAGPYTGTSTVQYQVEIDSLAGDQTITFPNNFPNQFIGVGDTLLGTVTGATGVVVFADYANNNTKLAITVTAGNFAGETALTVTAGPNVGNTATSGLTGIGPNPIQVVDTFKWSDDAGSTFTTFVPITPGVPQLLSNGITVTFQNGTGHSYSFGGYIIDLTVLIDPYAISGAIDGNSGLTIGGRMAVLNFYGDASTNGGMINGMANYWQGNLRILQNQYGQGISAIFSDPANHRGFYAHSATDGQTGDYSSRMPFTANPGDRWSMLATDLQDNTRESEVGIAITGIGILHKSLQATNRQSGIRFGPSFTDWVYQTQGSTDLGKIRLIDNGVGGAEAQYDADIHRFGMKDTQNPATIGYSIETIAGDPLVEIRSNGDLYMRGFDSNNVFETMFKADFANGYTAMGDLSGNWGLTTYHVFHEAQIIEMFGATHVATAPVFVGFGLNDMTAPESLFQGTTSVNYTITIATVGATDTFTWTDSQGNSGGPTLMTGSNQNLSFGTVILFAAITGHNLGDQWTFTVSQSYQTTMRMDNTQMSWAVLDVDGSGNGTSIFGSDLKGNQFWVINGPELVQINSKYIDINGGQKIKNRDVNDAIATIADTDYSVTGVGLTVNRVFTLPACTAALTDRVFILVNDYTSGANIDATPTGADTIGGAGLLAILPNQAAMLMCDGVSNYRVI